MEYQCVMCPEDQCSKDCPTLEVLPYEGPLKEENIRKGRKLIASGMKAEEIKEKLKAAGNADAKNELINKWMDEYDAKEKGPLYHIIKTKLQIIQQQRIIDKHEKFLEDANKFLEAYELKTSSVVDDESAPVAVVDDESAPVPVADDQSAPVAADEGLSGLKKIVHCVLCPFYTCSEDCPILEVLPYEGPLKEENIRKAQKIYGPERRLEEIKQKLRDAGGADAKNKLINKWIEEFDSRDFGPFVKNRLLLHQKRKILAQHNKDIEHGKKFLKALKALRTSSVPVVDDQTAPVAADEGLPGLKKGTSKN